jgi:NAD(P)-dependent dehydrogenase (short-subunit alcohol dehydrogenase family)
MARESGWSRQKPRRSVADRSTGTWPTERVDVLANNAGALFASRKQTPEGFERTFALNHLAPFLVTNLLRDRLAGGRVVTTASNAHKSGRLVLDDLQSEKSYSARAYGISKLCNVLFTRELARRAPELRANCFHPGVVRTGFAKGEDGVWKIVAKLGAPFFRSPERGARSLVWLAPSDDAAALTGEYIVDEKVVPPAPRPWTAPSHEASGSEALSSSAFRSTRAADATAQRLA